MQPEAIEVQPLDRMDSLALWLWKLRQHQEALSAVQISRDLAPGSSPSETTAIIKYASLTRLLSRIQGEGDVWERAEQREVRLWRAEAGYWNNRISSGNLEQMAKKDTDAWRVLTSAQHELARALERQAEALQTLAFRQWVAGRYDDACATLRQVDEVCQKAARTRDEIYSRLLLNGRSDLAQPPGTLALRLQASRGEGSSDRSRRNQRDAPPEVDPLPDSTQPGDPPP